MESTPFVPTTRLPEAGFLFSEVPPIANAYLGAEDNLFLVVYSSIAGTRVLVRARVLMPNGEIQVIEDEIFPTGDYVINTKLVRTGECFLLSAFVALSGAAPQRGRVYSALQVSRGTGGAQRTLNQVCFGYLTDASGITFPATVNSKGGEGVGAFRVITGTDPAAGAEVSETVPTAALWRLHALRVSLVTDATVASRYPFLVYDDGTTEFHRSGAGALQAASLTTIQNWAIGEARALLSTQAGNAPIPSGVWLAGGSRIRTVTANLQAGDNYGAPVYIVEELQNH